MLLAVLATACTVLTSEAPSEIIERAGRSEGVHYALPKGIVTATLNVYPDKAQFELTIDEKPEFVPDPVLRYFLRYKPRLNYEDEVTVDVNDKTFVTKIDVKTTDRTGDIIVNVAKALGALPGGLEAADAPAEAPPVRLAQLKFDPTAPEEVAGVIRRFNKAIKRFVKQAAAECKSLTENVSYPSIPPDKKNPISKNLTTSCREWTNSTILRTPSKTRGKRKYSD